MSLTSHWGELEQTKHHSLNILFYRAQHLSAVQTKTAQYPSAPLVPPAKTNGDERALAGHSCILLKVYKSWVQLAETCT